jgi:hypothetical protein
MPNYVWVSNENGAEYAVVASAFDPEVHKRVEGAEVELDANGAPRRKQSESTVTGEDVAGTERETEPTAPAQSDIKAAWVDHAVTQGEDPAEAEGSTKAELIEKYGS